MSKVQFRNASRYGYSTTIKKLIDEGFDPNFVDKEGFSPLYYASFMGFTDIVKVLIEADADPNTVCKRYYTPLANVMMSAVYPNKVVIVKLLLNATLYV